MPLIDGAQRDRWVPPPWEPLQHDGGTVRCWGRRLGFDGVLPAAVVSQETALLAAPMRLVVDGRRLATWTTSAVAADGRSASWRGVAPAPSAVVEGEVEVAYDGFCDVRVRVAGTVEALALEIPLRAEHARLLHFVREIPTTATNTIEVPDGEGVVWTAPFHCGAWLGSEDVGLFWCADDDRAFRLAEPDRALAVERRADVTVLRITFVDHLATLDRDVLHFGLTATPVRPRPPRWRDWRPAPGEGSNVVVEWWTRWAGSHAHTRPLDADDLRRRSDEARAASTCLLPYVSFATLASDSPAFTDGGAAGWRSEPLFGNADEGSPYWVMCPNTPWAAYFVEEMERLVRECRLTGLYVDFFQPLSCNAPSHPCGYTDKDGVRHPSYNVFAFRRQAQDLYERVKAADPDALLMIHCSDAMMYSAIGFGDLMVTGEEKRPRLLQPGAHYTGVLPLAELRADHRGHHAGLAPMFLPEFATPEGAEDVERTAHPAGTRELLALTLLHDVAVWPLYCHVATVVAAREAQRRFGVADARFCGYWEEGSPVTGGEGGVLVSAWLADDRALVVVANPTDTAAAATVRWAVDGEQVACTAQDAMGDGDVARDGEGVLVRVEPRDFRLLELRRAAD